MQYSIEGEKLSIYRRIYPIHRLRSVPHRLVADRLPSRRQVSRDLGVGDGSVKSIDAVRMYVAPSDELGARLIGRCSLRFADDESAESQRRLI